MTAWQPKILEESLKVGVAITYKDDKNNLVRKILMDQLKF
jgi:hypothetical protein